MQVTRCLRSEVMAIADLHGGQLGYTQVSNTLTKYRELKECFPNQWKSRTVNFVLTNLQHKHTITNALNSPAKYETGWLLY